MRTTLTIDADAFTGGRRQKSQPVHREGQGFPDRHVAVELVLPFREAVLVFERALASRDLVQERPRVAASGVLLKCRLGPDPRRGWIALGIEQPCARKQEARR